MARKKSNKTKKKEEAKINVNKGEIIYLQFEELPGKVLGKLYEVDGVQARLVYIGEKSKLIVE